MLKDLDILNHIRKFSSSEKNCTIKIKLFLCSVASLEAKCKQRTQYFHRGRNYKKKLQQTFACVFEKYILKEFSENIFPPEIYSFYGIDMLNVFFFLKYMTDFLKNYLLIIFSLY